MSRNPSSTARRRAGAEIGDRIAARRTALGISRPELATRSGLNQSTIWRYESGQQYPGAIELQAVAEALKCRVDELLPGGGSGRERKPRGSGEAA